MSANGAMSDDSDTSDDGPEIVEQSETVEVDTSSDDDGERAAAPEPRTGKQGTRKERRANAMREATEAREASERKEREANDRAARFESQLAEMRGYIAAQHQQRQQDPNDTLAKKVEALEDEANAHLERAAIAQQNKDAAGAAKWMRLYHAKNREAARLEMAEELRPQLEERFNKFQQNMPDTQAGAVIAQAAQEFPWLTTDSEAEALANHNLAKLLAAGRPRSIATIREACTAAAKRLGIGGRASPTAAQRQRFAVVPNGEGGGGGGDSRTQVVMGRAERAMAESLYKNLPAKEAHRAWAKMVQESRSKGDDE